MAKRNSKCTDRHAPVLEALESRVLYSADPFGGLLDTGLLDSEPDWIDSDAFADALADTLTTISAKEVILINNDVNDLGALHQSILDQISGRDAVVYILDAERDGVAQTLGLLSQHDSVEAVHLFSHGRPGAFALGETQVNVDVVQQRADELAALATVFSTGADLLIYGCETGAESDELLTLLANQLQIDIAASDDLTGNTAQGGDWDLEVQAGSVEHFSLLEDGAADDWAGLLATLNVTTTADTFDADTGASTAAEIIADPGPDGLLSLREAIFASNLESDADEIVLQAGTYVTAITGGGNESGDFDIRESVTIRGQGADATIIDVGGNGNEIGFDINNGTVVFEDFTLTGAVVSGGGKGAGIDVGGADLTLNRLTIDDNKTDNGVGGGVYIKNSATVTIIDSVLSNNIAGDGAAPNLEDGGAIYNQGTLSIVRTEINDNSAKDGGGIYSSGTLTIEDSSFARNSATADGGGIYKKDGGLLDLERVTLEANISANDGGGAWINADSNLDYVTFSGNTASNAGAGLLSTGADNQLHNSTFYGNVASATGSALMNTGTLAIKGTAFSANSVIGDVVAGSVASLGFNSWQPASVTYAVDSDLVGLDSSLAALQDNGGYVKTHLPMAGSPLIDAGYNNAGVDATGTAQNSIPDIGAVESRGTTVLEKVYWLDTAERAIYRSDIDGSEKQLVLTTTLVPFDIEVDSVNGFLYWIESDSDYESPRNFGSLFRSDMDGGNRTELKAGIKFPSGLALDLGNEHIYVSSDPNSDNSSAPYVNYVLRYDLTGGNETIAAAGQSDLPVAARMVAPTDVEFDETTQILYWSDRSTNLSTINAEIKMRDFNSGSPFPSQLLELDKGAGERAYGLAVGSGTTTLSIATQANVTTYDYSTGATSKVVLGGATRGVASAEESGGHLVTDQSGVIVHVKNLFQKTEIHNGLAEPGAIAVAYLDPVNIAPVLQENSTLGVDEAGTKKLSAAVLDASDLDTPDNEVVFTVTTPPASGEIRNSSGVSISSFSIADIAAEEVIYAHNGSRGGTDQFTFTIGDGVNTSVEYTFNITVSTFDDSPVAGDDSYTLNEGASQNLAVLSNDDDEESGLDVASIVFVTPPAHGAAVLHGDGSVDYTHNGSETTGDSFQYTVEDLSGNVSNTATVTINVTPVSDPPVAVADTANVIEGGSVNIDVSDNDADSDDGLDLPSVAVIAAPANGSAIPVVDGSADGSIAYVHDGSETLNDTFTYRIRDSSGQWSNTVEVNVSIDPVNDAPDAQDDADNVAEGAATTISVLSNDTDADNSIVANSVSIAIPPVNGSVSVSAGGTITYTHSGSETLSDSFDYTVSDASGAISNVATVNIAITAVNDSPVATNDVLTLDEGTSLTAVVLDNDTDAEGALDNTTVTMTSGPINGVATINPDGTITYTHDGSETTSDSLKYTVNDATGATSNVATVDITITAVNVSPIAADDVLTVDEGSSFTAAVLGNDSDAEGALDNTTVVLTAYPFNGVATVNPDGTITYTHDGSETTNDRFEYTVNDASGATSNVATVDITVTAVNDSPVAMDDVLTVDEGASFTAAVLGNDTDAEGALDNTTVTMTSGPINGVATINPDGTITYTHDGSETTSDSFKYTVNDATAATSNVATVDITITAVNDSPVATDDALTVDEGTSLTAAVLGNDTDAEGALDTTSVVLTASPLRGGVIINPDGTITYTHDGTETGSDTFAYTVNDVSGLVSNMATVSVTVDAVNDRPLALPDTVVLDEGAHAIVSVLTNDTDADDGLDHSSVAITIDALHGSAIANADGTISYTHDGSETTSDSLSYTVSDSAGEVSVAALLSIVINPVNDGPVSVADSVSVDEGGTAMADLLTNDNDADDGINAASVSIVGAPSHGTTFVNADGSVSYEHDGSETTSDIYQYTVEDNAGVVSNVASVAVNVSPVNDPPIANPDSYTVTEGEIVPLSPLANDSDSENPDNPGVAEVVSVPDNGSIEVLSDNTLLYTHDDSESLMDRFSYRVRDNGGAYSLPVWVNITVSPVNDRPVGHADLAIVAETGTVVIAVLDNDTDAESGIDHSAISIESAPAHGSTTVATDGSIHYVHDGSETVRDSFTYTLADVDGARSLPVGVDIEVSPVNDPPTASNDTMTVLEGATAVFNVLSNDLDSEGGLDAGSVRIGTQAVHGFAQVQGDGSIEYTHDGSETTQDLIHYRVSDAQGLQSNNAVVTVQVIPLNDAPVALADQYTVDEGTDIKMSVLANDTDAEGDIDPASVVVERQPVYGTAAVNVDGTVSYSHDGSENHFDTLTYRVSDDGGATSAPQRVTIEVEPVNDNPIARADVAEVSEGGRVHINILANDADAEQVPSAEMIQLRTLPAHGTVTIITGPVNTATVNTDGVVQYQHDGSESLRDSFSYSLTDTDGANSEEVTVVITVVSVDDLPVAVDDSFTLDEGESVNLALVENDHDADSSLDDQQVEIVALPQHGELILSGDGGFRYIHDGSETTTDQFSYRLVSPSGLTSAPATVSLDISPVNDSPQLTVAPTMTVAAPFSLQLPATTAIDAESQSLHFAATLADGSALPESVVFDQDTLTLSVSRQWDSSLPDSVLITISDPEGAQTSLMVLLQSAEQLQFAQATPSDIAYLPKVWAPVVHSAAVPVPVDAAVIGKAIASAKLDASVETDEPQQSANILNSTPDQVENSAVDSWFTNEPVTRQVGTLESAQERDSRATRTSVGNSEAEPQVNNETAANLLIDVPVSLSEYFDLEAFEKHTSHLSQLLDETQQERINSEVLAKQALAVSAVTTSALSVGYTLWLIRGGMLLGSFLTTLPAWRFVDPFPVLSRFDEEDEGSEAESLQHIVENRSEAVAPTPAAIPMPGIDHSAREVPGDAGALQGGSDALRSHVGEPDVAGRGTGNQSAGDQAAA